MKKTLTLSLALILFLTSMPNLCGQTNPYDKYLAVADIEKVTGLSDLKQVPREPRKGAGGHLNFADKNGSMILTVSFLTAQEYGFYRNEKRMVKVIKDNAAHNLEELNRAILDILQIDEQFSQMLVKPLLPLSTDIGESPTTQTTQCGKPTNLCTLCV